MPSVWKTVRVFISSTFRDMHAERDHLIKVVFPALRERLEKYRIYLDDIDLRWGVTKEQAENDQVLDLCLQQIDECRPFFIGILGERYGWVPTQFPASTLSSQGWVQHHTGKSVTDLEMVYGVFTKPPMRSRAFFYFRDPMALAAMPDDIRSSTFAETEPERIGQLADLKQRIRQNAYPLMEPYPARWDAQAYDRPSRSSGRLVGLEAFGECVREQLWEAIKAEHNLPDAPPPETALDSLAVELDYHERFMESRLRVHVLRQQINDALLAFAENDATAPCLLTGPSGSGKSASLARFVLDYQRTHPDALIVPHFIGASPRSTNLREMLRRFCQVLKAHLGLADEVPEEVTKLAVAFREFVGKVPPDMRVLFVIDALNQLDETDRAQNLAWLPVQFPPQVKVVVSCISDSEKVEPALEAIAQRQHVSLTVSQLDDEERRKIIQAVPSLSAKALDDQQIEQLLANRATTNPLFLLVALEELRGFGSYERLNERIAAFPREGDTVTAIFTQVIERLEEEFAKEVVRPVLLLLAVARRGLSERELQELVAGLPGADDLFPILRQLKPYLLRRAGLIDFYHRNLLKGVRGRYLETPEKKQAGHARLADYFNGQDYWQESLEEQRTRATRLPPTPRTANVRKVDELLWQRIQAGELDHCEKLLTELVFLEAKVEGGLVFDVAEEFQECVERLSAGSKFQYELTLLREALGQDIHFIARHPTTLFQCLWNNCWWYDRPEERGEDEWRKSSLPTVHLGGPLHRLVERWRREKESITPGFSWLRSRRPNLPWLGSGLTNTLHGHTAEVESVAFSSDGKSVASGSRDQTVRVWNADNGQLIWVRRFPCEVRGVAFSSDHSQILVRLSGSNDGKAIRLLDARGGDELLTLSTYFATSAAFSEDGKHIAVGFSLTGEPVSVWDAQQGTCLLCLGDPNGEHYGARAVAFSRDGSKLAGAFSEQVIIWNTVTGEQRQSIEVYSPSAIAFSPDGTRLGIATSATGNNLRVVDIQGPRELLAWIGHKGPVTGIVFSPDGKCLASSSWDGAVRLWDAETGQQINSVLLQGNYVLSIAFSADGGRLAIGTRAGNVHVWNISMKVVSRPVADHRSEILDINFSPDGSMLASGGWDGTVRLWDFARGVEQTCWESGEGARMERLQFSPDGRRLLCEVKGIEVHQGVQPHSVRLWDVQSGTFLRDFQDVRCGLSFSPDGTRLAGCFNRRVWIWNAGTGEEVEYLHSRERHDASVANSPDGHQMALCAYDHSIRVCDAQSGREKLCLRGHTKWIPCLAFSEDGIYLASGSADWTVRLWHTGTGQEVRCFQHTQPVLTLAFSTDGRHLAGGAKDNTVRIWNIGSGAWVLRIDGVSDAASANVWRVLEKKSEGLTHLALSPNGEELAYILSNNTVRIERTGSGEELYRLVGHVSLIHYVAFSRDGRFIATGGEDKTVRLWDTASGQPLGCYLHQAAVTRVAFSSDGTRVYGSSHNNVVRSWYTDSGDPGVGMTGPDAALVASDEPLGTEFRPPASSVLFSPDGRWIAAWSDDATIRLWDVQSKMQIHCLAGHRAQVTAIAFSPDGEWLASIARDCTLRLWHTETGQVANQQLAIVPESVAFSQDGTLLAVISNHGSVYRWEMQTGTCLERIEGMDELASILNEDKAMSWRVCRRSTLETVVEWPPSGQAVAWFSRPLAHVRRHPAGRAWAGASGNHLCLFLLEGTQ